MSFPALFASEWSDLPDKDFRLVTAAKSELGWFPKSSHADSGLVGGTFLFSVHRIGTKWTRSIVPPLAGKLFIAASIKASTLTASNGLPAWIGLHHEDRIDTLFVYLNCRPEFSTLGLSTGMEFTPAFPSPYHQN